MSTSAYISGFRRPWQARAAGGRVPLIGMACQVAIFDRSPVLPRASSSGRRDNRSPAQQWTRLSFVRLPVGPPPARLFYALPPWGGREGGPPSQCERFALNGA